MDNRAFLVCTSSFSHHLFQENFPEPRFHGMHTFCSCFVASGKKKYRLLYQLDVCWRYFTRAFCVVKIYVLILPSKQSSVNYTNRTTYNIWSSEERVFFFFFLNKRRSHWAAGILLINFFLHTLAFSPLIPSEYKLILTRTKKVDSYHQKQLSEERIKEILP